MSSAADLLGADIMSGDPHGVSLLASRMSSLARDIHAMRDKFSARALGGIWTGEAYAAFSNTLEDVPRDLERVSTSYTMAGQALDSYAVALEEAQRTGRQLAADATDAEAQATAADRDRSSAKRELHAAKVAHGGATDPIAQRDAQRRVQMAATRVAAAEQRHSQAEAEASGARSRASTAVATFQTEVDLCCQRLRAASEAGIQNTPLSWYNRHIANTPWSLLLFPIGDVFTGVADIAVLSHNIGDLAAWRGALAAAGTVLAVAAVVIAVLGTGGIALVIVGGLSVAAAGAGLGVDMWRVRRGDISSDALTWDGVELGMAVIPFAGDAKGFLPAWRAAGRTTNATVYTRFIKYGTHYQHMTRADRLDQLISTGVSTYGPEYERRIAEPIMSPANHEPCVIPRPGLGASPVGVIRHFRPINPRPIVLAHGP